MSTDRRTDHRLRWGDPFMPTFVQLLANVLLVSVINFTVWFAITFFVYLETRSVFATGMIAGIFLVATMLTGIWFGSLVDHHSKKAVMQGSALASLVLYAAAFGLYLVTPREEFTDPTSVRLWVFVVLLMTGMIAGNLRTIALPTVVTALVPEHQRDRANGLVGTTSGVAFLVTSVISGLLVGANGMFGVLVLAIVVISLALVHLPFVRIPADVDSAADDGDHKVDLAGTVKVVRGIPGMPALIVFSTINNFLGGVFMALMDAYGLSMVSVQTWGLLWGALSGVLIVTGLLITRTGLSSNPVRLILLINLAMWTTTVIFPLRNSIIWLTVGDGRLHGADPLRRGLRADGAAEGGALRATGTGVRLRPERRAVGLAADRVPDQPAGAVRVHPVHDRRAWGRLDRRLVGDGPDARRGAGVRARRPAGPGPDDLCPHQPLLPPAA